MDYSFAFAAVFVLFLDHGCPLAGLVFLFDHRCSFSVTIAIVVPVTITNGDTGANRACANANFFGGCRDRERARCGGNE
jgi:hypothetical protein